MSRKRIGLYCFIRILKDKFTLFIEAKCQGLKMQTSGQITKPGNSILSLTSNLHFGLFFSIFAHMENVRQQKVARLIQKEMAEIFQTTGKEITGGALVTVTRVSVTRDLGLARIFVSVFGPGNKDSVVGNVNQHRREIRHQLGLRVKNQLRSVPEIEFVHDDTLDYLDRIDQLLKQ